MRRLLLPLLLSACASTPVAQTSPSRPVPEARAGSPTDRQRLPKLVVLVVVDQLGQAHLDQWGHLFQGGLARLTGPGAYRATGVYPHAVTETCPGHATLATGASPSVHGIVSNHFPLDGKPSYCLEAEPLPAQTIGDIARAGGAKVATVSIKDRGATLIAGQDASLVVWVDRKTGIEQTGSHAEHAPLSPPLVPTETWMAWAAEPWVLHDPDRMKGIEIADDQEHENDPGVGTTFPHASGDTTDGPAGLARRLMVTPVGGDYLTAAGLAAIERVPLGATDTPDFLSLSYSHFDGIGHAFTPLSLEGVDSLLRLDLQLADLFEGLDARVGAGQWTVVLSADHGTPMGVPHYVDLEPLGPRLDEALAAAGLPALRDASVTAISLQAGLTPQQRRASLSVARRVAGSIEGTVDVLDLNDPTGPFADAWRLNLYPGRNADFEVILAEGAIPMFRGMTRGTTHGSPRSYDTEVPVLAWGVGVKSGAGGRVDVRSVAPTVAALLGLAPPAQAEAPPLTAALSVPEP